MNFDGALLPDGVATLPRTLDLTLTIGTEAYPGTTSLGPDELHVHENEWETEEED